MKTRIILITALILLASFSTFAVLKGRDLVDKGEQSNLRGYLKNDGTEWYLSSNNEELLIHMGPEFYQDEIGLNLSENTYVEINGFVYENEITPISIMFDGKEYTLRDETGRPKWAGRGNRSGNYRNENSYRQNNQNEKRENNRNFRNQK